MKQSLILVSSLLILGLFGCSDFASERDLFSSNDLPNANSINDLEPENLSFPIEVGTFTIDELFDAGGGGCGMSLWESKINPQQEGFLFFNGLEDASTFIVLDDRMTNLTRTYARGEDFYGQQTEQVFMTADKEIAVEVKVNLGAEGEIESVEIPSGEIVVRTQAKTKKFSVVGDAGC